MSAEDVHGRLLKAASTIADVLDGGERDPTWDETQELEHAAVLFGRSVRGADVPWQAYSLHALTRIGVEYHRALDEARRVQHSNDRGELAGTAAELERLRIEVLAATKIYVDTLTDDQRRRLSP